MNREGRTETQQLDDTPLPSSPGLAPWAGLGWQRASRQRGRGRASDFEDGSSRSMPAPAGAAGTRKVVTRQNRKAVQSSPGLSLTSRRPPTLAVAGPLLLPPLLLTSTSLCRKVDLAPRPTQTQRRKRSSEVWD